MPLSPESTLDDYLSHLEERGVDPYKIYGSDEITEDKRPEYRDTPYFRGLRAQAQYDIEMHMMEHLKGRSVLERAFVIRERLFEKFSTVHDENPVSLREQQVSASVILFPSSELVQRELFPSYVKLMDQLYEECLKAPADVRAKQAERLAAIAYSLGILMHPFIDGNGQTFRTVALSYLRELSLDYQDRYFKFKLGDGGAFSSFSLDDEAEKKLFESRIERENTDLMDYDILQEIRTIIPKGSNGFPLSLDGAKAYLLARKLNPTILSPSEAYKFFLQREEQLEASIQDNSLFIKRQARDKLEEIARIKSGFCYPTLNKDGVVRINLRNHEHERFYYDVIHTLGGDKDALGITPDTAIDILRNTEVSLNRRLKSLESDRNIAQRKVLEEFLQRLLSSDEGVGFNITFLTEDIPLSVRDTDFNSALRMYRKFLNDITVEKDTFFENKPQHVMHLSQIIRNQ